MEYLETKRLIIRPLKEEDLPILYTFEMSDFVRKYNMIPKREYPAYLVSIRKRMHENWVLELKDSHEIVGCITVMEDTLRYDIDSVNLSYWLGEEFTKKGYMYEALDAFIYSLNHEIIAARVFTDNVDSVRLMRKLDFVEEGLIHKGIRDFDGIVHDDYIFAKYKDA